MNLRRTVGPPLVIGHRGAKALAPENTLASLQAALDAGADVVEFDVAPGLVVGHSAAELPDDRLTLDGALDFLAGSPAGIHVDVKVPGYERPVVEAVRRHGLEDRVLCSTAFAVTARRLAALAPGRPVAIGYPRDRHHISRLPWPALPTRAGAACLRAAMPARIPLLLRASRANVLALHHTLCSPTAVAAAHRSGAPVLAWTANDAAAVRRLVGAGVDAIVSDDPLVVREALATLFAQ